MNREQPHIVILPEDDANRQIANGFLTHLNVKYRSVRILPLAGGCKKTADKFEKELIPLMMQYREMTVILLIDGDQKQSEANNYSYAVAKVPNNLKNRVFILGVFSEPEELKKEIGSYEIIGEKLADDCYDNTDTLWGHSLLVHNKSELERMAFVIKPIIF